jgi:hypothetical protein
MARQIFLIAWLLADKHDRRLPRALAEDSLSCVFPEIASLAGESLRAQFVDRLGRLLKRWLGRKNRLLAALANFFAFLLSWHDTSPYFMPAFDAPEPPATRDRRRFFQ